MNKLVSKIELPSTSVTCGGVRVYTSDGSCYNGNLLVGADGVHSKVRSEMWRHADEKRPGLITSEEKKC